MNTANAINDRPSQEPSIEDRYLENIGTLLFDTSEDLIAFIQDQIKSPYNKHKGCTFGEKADGTVTVTQNAGEKFESTIIGQKNGLFFSLTTDGLNFLRKKLIFMARIATSWRYDTSGYRFKEVNLILDRVYKKKDEEYRAFLRGNDKRTAFEALPTDLRKIFAEQIKAIGLTSHALNSALSGEDQTRFYGTGFDPAPQRKIESATPVLDSIIKASTLKTSKEFEK